MTETKNDNIRQELAGTNINQKTFLATDYLNHFNEVIMLMDMLPDVPECIEDTRDWSPKTYEEHFRDSSFSEKELAIKAYHNAPQEFRAPLDALALRLNRKIADTLDQIEQLISAGDQAATAILLASASKDLRAMIKLASSIINGTSTLVTEDQIDEMLCDTEETPLAQDDIDALF